MRLFALFLSLFAVALAQADPAQMLLVSAGGKVTSYAINEGTGELKEIHALEVGSSGVLGRANRAGRFFLNTSAEGEDGKKVPSIATLQMDQQGKLSVTRNALSGISAGYLRMDSTGRFLAGNNYGAGKVIVWKLAENGTFEGETVRVFDLERCAHAAVFSPDNQTLFVPATAPNKIFQLKFNNETGDIVPRQPSAAPGPVDPKTSQQPRHLLFHPKKAIAYATHERENPGVGVYTYNAEKGILELAQSLLSIDAPFEGISTATLRLSPDNRFLYVSNRDGGAARAKPPKPGRDSIALFAVDQESGHLSFVKRFPSPSVPRSFCLDIKGEYLFASGQGYSKLATYRIDPKTGHLTELNRIDLAGRPTWVMPMMIPAR